MVGVVEVQTEREVVGCSCYLMGAGHVMEGVGVGWKEGRMEGW